MNYTKIAVEAHDKTGKQIRLTDGQNMKSKLILTCAVVAIPLYLSDCSPTTKEVSVDVSCDDFMLKSHNRLPVVRIGQNQ